MFGFMARTSSPPSQLRVRKTPPGEIDTRAPFQSVKAAVSLFGDAVISPKVSPVSKQPKDEEIRPLDKETQHQMILRELDCYKDHLRSAELAKSQALKDLGKANTTVQILANKLQIRTKSKQDLIKATEAAKTRSKDLEEYKNLREKLGVVGWKQHVEKKIKYYNATAAELVLRKEELSNLRKQLDAALEEKLAAFEKAEVAQRKTKAAQEKQSQLLKEVAPIREAFNLVKLEAQKAEEEHSKLIADKETLLNKYKSAKEEADKEIKSLREENISPERLKEKLDETAKEINILHSELNVFSGSDLYPLLSILRELESNKKALQQVVAQEKKIQSSLEPLEQELEEVEMAQPRSSLEMLIASNDMHLSYVEEAHKSRQEAEDIKTNVLLLEQEAEAARIAAKEYEDQLQIALKQAEEAKAAKKLAEDKISKESGSVRKIRLSTEEFELMNKKIEEVINQTNVTVANSMAEVVTIKEREKEVSQKIEVIEKENDNIQSEINKALKTAKTEETAKIVLARELQTLRKK